MVGRWAWAAWPSAGHEGDGQPDAAPCGLRPLHPAPCGRRMSAMVCGWRDSPASVASVRWEAYTRGPAPCILYPVPCAMGWCRRGACPHELRLRAQATAATQASMHLHSCMCAHPPPAPRDGIEHCVTASRSSQGRRLWYGYRVGCRCWCCGASEALL